MGLSIYIYIYIKKYVYSRINSMFRKFCNRIYGAKYDFWLEKDDLESKL